VTRAATPQDAVAGAGVVCAFTAAADADAALRQALPSIERGAVYADFATAAAGLKRQLAGIAASAGAGFADVALMAGVPGKGLTTPALVSGPGAVRFAEVFSPLGMPVEVCGTEPGEAATRKLLRSVVMKGLSAVLIESMRAATVAGLAEETWANLVEQFTAADEALLRRLVEGTYQHARRRVHEMEATADLLTELGVAPVMTAATTESLRAVERGDAGSPPVPDP
jgi:3-hydroxyisobutyrate dehydrogenase-like beta-hydroxyacid dehydrogenase